MKSPLRILIADDDAGDRKQMVRAIRRSGLSAECVETASMEEALEVAKAGNFDLAILDFRLPGQDGLDGITAMRERDPLLPLVMATGQGDEAVATEAMKRGAADYMRKGDVDPETVLRVIQNAVEKAALKRKVAEQQEELENFARVMVHDLRSPAASILGIARLIGQRLQEGQPEQAVEYAAWVVESARRMNRLIDTLRQYTLADAQVVFEPVEMERVKEDVRANLDQLLRATGAVVTAGPLPAVKGNPSLLMQLLQNLVANGIKYCERPVPSIHLSASMDEAAKWRFAVKDNGIGIPERHYKKVFEPFKRMNGADRCDGTGLGLATCRKIVERHGGTIWCESVEGTGSTFFFTLPPAVAVPRFVAMEQDSERGNLGTVAMP